MTNRQQWKDKEKEKGICVPGSVCSKTCTDLLQQFNNVIRTISIRI